MHYLSEHQTFESTAELNKAIYEHIKRNSYDLNETERTVLKTIARYAVKFSGAAHLKADTLAELIGKSVKTARRALNKLTELEIVKKVTTTRKVNGGYGANIIVILPVKNTAENVNDQSTMTTRTDTEKLEGTSNQIPKTKTEPTNSTKQFKNQNQVLDTVIPSEALQNSLPGEIYSAMSRYFEAEDIYKYYGVLLRAKKSVDSNIILENHASAFTQVWHAAILQAKQGYVKNFENYLYVGFRQAAIEIKRRMNTGGLMGRFKAMFENE
ncbi:helix-turn-helix domain-containing protein [Bacillus atrophaeus]|uniref:helix-turn-helix domain-containing protein n=1 Tax=Bacillus atrophaeus TaxID=1452 RepID=UPI002282A98C|nr:helix-turn-helix domain-containing protein [Bacillus atrophaeus]MCY9198914.1 helix-turn-helix domain-containing protein [Bacillus atrophaeus]